MPESEDNWFWRRAAPILSLDMVGPFFDFMGLRVSDAAAFRRFLRERIVALRPPKSSGVTPPDADAWVADLNSRLAGMFGADFLENFHKWMHSVLLPPGDMPYNAWRLLLSDAARSVDTWRNLGFIGEDAEVLLQRYQSLSDFRLIQELMKSTRAQKMSKWDTAMYALYNFYEEMNDPVDDAGSAAKRQQLFTFWREMESATTVEERDAMLLKAQARAKQKGMSLTLRLLDSNGWATW